MEQKIEHLLTKDELKLDLKKTQALSDMKPPTNKEDLQCFLGMLTYLAKFIPNLSQASASLARKGYRMVVASGKSAKLFRIETVSQQCSCPLFYPAKRSVDASFKVWVLFFYKMIILLHIMLQEPLWTLNNTLLRLRKRCLL